MKQYIDNGSRMPLAFLDSLRLRFESVLFEKKGQAMGATSCLSQPELYHEALLEKSEYGSLHGDFTLLLARNVNSWSDAERAQRVKEVLTMMRLSTKRKLYCDLRQVQGMEAFFNENRYRIVDWIRDTSNIPHIFENLGYLAHAQAEQPDIGSLWRTNKKHAFFLTRAFKAFDMLIIALDKPIPGSITQEQHLVLVTLICQDTELEKIGIFKDFHSVESSLSSIDDNGDDDDDHVSFHDPSLQFLFDLTAGFDTTLPNDTSLFQDSWARIAQYLMKYYRGTESPYILKMQAFAWKLVPRKEAEALCNQALGELHTLVSLVFPLCTALCHLKCEDPFAAYIRVSCAMRPASPC